MSINITERILDCKIENIQGHYMLFVSGDIDVHTAVQFKQAVTSILDVTERHLIIDIHNVEYMDSSGLGILAYAVKRLSHNSGTVNLVGCNPRIDNILYITQMSAFVRLHETMDDAINALFTPVSV